MSTSVKVTEAKSCDFCKFEENTVTLATIDGLTIRGPWANMCSSHHKTMGRGLGTGFGQELLYPEAVLVENGYSAVTRQQELDYHNGYEMRRSFLWSAEGSLFVKVPA